MLLNSEEAEAVRALIGDLSLAEQVDYEKIVQEITKVMIDTDYEQCVINGAEFKSKDFKKLKRLFRLKGYIVREHDNNGYKSLQFIWERYMLYTQRG